MKKLSLFLSVMVCLVACNKAQILTVNTQKKAPNAAVKHFNAQWPDAMHIEWSEEDGNFEVNCEDGEHELEVVYSQKGALLLIEEELSLDELPATLSNAIAAQYPGMNIDEAERVTKGEVVLYELELTRENIRMEALFDAEGNMIEEDSEDEEDDEDDN